MSARRLILLGATTLSAPGAAPIDAADGAAYTGIASISIGDRCTAALIDTGVEDAPAYLLTNGHCAAARNAGANEVILDDPSAGEAVFAPFADDPDGLVTLAIAGVPYSTMKGRDVSIAQLDVTLGAARAAGLVPLAIAPTPPAPGDPVINVGVPVQGYDEAEWVLRRGECRLGEQVDLVEFVWHFDDSWANDCPGIRGGSSGSPLLDGDGRIVGLINTTSVGAPEGGDCYLGKPCEVSTGSTAVVADRSYAVPVAGIERCFDAGGVFDVTAAGCVLDPGGGITARVDRRAVQPTVDGGEATTTATIDGPRGTEFATKSGPAGEVDCADSAGYGEAQPLNETAVVDVTVPGDDGVYVFCAAEPGSAAMATTSVVQVDSTPPVVQPELSIVDGGDVVLVEPIFAVPELSDFVVKIGRPADTDCAHDDGYVRYRRVPFDVPASDLPVAVCVIGSDEAGNESEPYRQLIEPRDETSPSAQSQAGIPAEIAVSGVVRYLERIALPSGAVVTVRVEDVSLADAPSTVIAEQVIEPTHQVPIPFALTLDADERRTYALRAQITVDGELWWTTDTFVPVSATESTTDLDVTLVRVADSD